MSETINNRYEFVLFYDVENGNPNGDPDAGNMPRIDPETGYGIVTDVAIKRKIRNYVELVKADEVGYRIYIKENIPLNTQHRVAYEKKGWDPKDVKPADSEKVNALAMVMCENFFDVRTFGAVMSTKINAGQVRGPVQITFSRSVDPIVQQEVTITRMTVTAEDADKKSEMGRKHIVPYAMYRVEGFVSAKLANDPTKGTGFSEDDLSLLWDSLENMFEHDHSASRGKMASRKLFVFKHESDLGNAPSHRLFEKIDARRKQGVVIPRSYKDYDITVDRDMPEGVTLIEKL